MSDGTMEIMRSLIVSFSNDRLKIDSNHIVLLLEHQIQMIVEDSSQNGWQHLCYLTVVNEKSY